ncbi:hypothetical protein [uncultured Paracoccus sp.]|uniref:hypothetical protein n=1 Tax=uncultured Paracoccus sp. TaxID=189685 RepID=UPI0025F69816|nr:hypothetical protein [uncultured Paracoccus sp.]
MMMDFLLRQGAASSFDLSDLYPGATGFAITTSDGANATAAIADGVLTVTPGALGHADLVLSFTDADGNSVTDSFRAIVAGENAYSIIAVPDTQSYTSTGDPEIRAMFAGMIQNIAAHKDALNIAHVLQVGDVTDNNYDAQWQIAQDAWSHMDGVIGYTLAVGNHDMGDGGHAQDFTSKIDGYFTPEQLGTDGTYDGYDTPSLRNSYNTFTSPDGQDWLILSLELGAPDDVLRWAGEVIEGHLDHRVIINTHSWNGGDKRVDPTTEPLTGENGAWGYGIRNDPRNVNDGEDMYRELASKYPNISFTFGGHNFLDGAETVVSQTAGGNSLYQVFVNYQNGISGEITGAGDPSLGGRGGNGAFRIVVVDPDNDRITTHTKFTALDKFFERVDHQETFENAGIGAPEAMAIAKAGADLVVTADAGGRAELVLDASGTILPEDGRPLSYAWYDAQGTLLAQGDTPALSVNLGQGTNRLVLEVRDDQGHVSRDDRTVIVEGPRSLLTETFDDGIAQDWTTPAALRAPFTIGSDTGFGKPSVSGGETLALNLSFDSSFRPYDKMVGDVMVSYDGGATWSVLKSFTTANSGGNSSLAHVNERVSIDFFAPDSAESVMVGFRASQADNDWWWAIDDVELSIETPEGRKTLLSESFDGLAGKLQPAVDEAIPAGTPGWTHEAPEGWARENAAEMPAGTTEWSGWSFATPQFWTSADQQQRDHFTLGDGVIAIADPDEWDDFNGGAAGQADSFDSRLKTPAIDLRPHGGGQTAAQPASVVRIDALAPHQGILVKPDATGAITEYTLVLDILADRPAKNWAGLLQTDVTNTTDADVYLQGDGGIGISSVYDGSFAFGQWNRVTISVSVEDGAHVMRKYIDGTLVGTQTVDGNVANGSRWTIDADKGFLLFADRDNYTSEMFVNAVAFTPERLSDARIAAMGKVDADGPLAGSDIKGAFQLNFDGALDQQDFGQASIGTLGAADSLGSFLVKGSVFGNPNGKGEGALYAQTDGGNEILVYQGNPGADWTNYVFDMVVEPADNDTLGAVFYWQDEDNHYELAINQQTFTRQLVRVQNGERTVLAEENGAYRHFAPQDLRIAVGATGIIVTLDDDLLFGGPVVDADPLSGGTVGVLSRQMSRLSFDEVSVNGQVLSARALGQTTAIDLDGDGREGIAVTAAATISPSAIASYDWLIGGKVVATGRDAVIAAGLDDTQVTLRVTDVDGKVSRDRIDIAVTGRDKLLFADDFRGGSLDRYTIVDNGDNGPSDWRIVDGALTQTSNIGSGQQGPGWDAWSLGGEGAYILRDGTYALIKGGADWTDYAVEVDVTPTDDDGLGVMVRYVDDQNYYKVELDDQAGLAQIIRVEDGYETVLARGWHNYAQGDTFRLRVEAEGDRLSVSVDGAEVFGSLVTDTTFAKGGVALYSYASTGLGFDDLAVIGLDGTPSLNVVMGTAGRDRLVGTDGADKLIGAGGTMDMLTGGAGADVFHFGFEALDGARARSTITDYEVGVDRISLAAGVTVAEVKQAGATVVAYLDDPHGMDDAIYIRGAGVTAATIVFVTDDLLVGA